MAMRFEKLCKKNSMNRWKRLFSIVHTILMLLLLTYLIYSELW